MAPPWSETRCELPPDLPTMISAEEASYLAWLGGEFWDGQSDIVEIGPWLGGSTWCLASGMATRERSPDARLHVVDNFRWRAFMSARGPQLADGDSFRPLFEDNLAPFRELLAVHEMRLPDEALGDIELDQPGRDYDSGLPLLTGALVERAVQILFVDGAKSFPAFAHMLRELGPRLAAGSLLVLQDFKASHAYWVPIGVAAMLRAQPGCLCVEHVLPANTIAWAVRPPLDAALAALPDSLAQVSATDGIALIDEAVRSLEAAGDANGARIVALGGVPFLAAKEDWAGARQRLRRSEREWPLRDPGRPLEAMRDWLTHKSDQAVPATFARARRRAYHRLARRLRSLRSPL